MKVPGGPSEGLNESRLGAEKSLLVGVKNRHKADFGKVQTLPEQVDPHQSIELTLTELFQNLDSVQGVYIGVEVLALDPLFVEKAVSFSAIFFVSVVIRVLSPAAVLARSPREGSPFAPLLDELLSPDPAGPGRSTISVGLPWLCSNSYSLGWRRRRGFGEALLDLPEGEGRLSRAEGRRKPFSTRVLRERSPLYMARIWGTVMWLSSMIMKNPKGNSRGV